MGNKIPGQCRIKFIAADARQELADWLGESGFEVTRIHTEGIVLEPLADHPDIFMCRLGISEDSEIVFSRYFRAEADSHIEGCSGGTALNPVYPGDIAFNAACTGRFFIHNLKYSAPELLEAAKDRGMTLINTRQGYSKCSTVIVDENSVITYDDAIAKPCEAAGMNVLKIRPGHILLPGFDTGFIGGTSGRIGDTLIFNGDLAAHPDFEAIKEFVCGRGLNIKWFEEWPLTDIGSII